MIIVLIRLTSCVYFVNFVQSMCISNLRTHTRIPRVWEHERDRHRHQHQHTYLFLVNTFTHAIVRAALFPSHSNTRTIVNFCQQKYLHLFTYLSFNISAIYEHIKFYVRHSIAFNINSLCVFCSSSRSFVRLIHFVCFPC